MPFYEKGRLRVIFSHYHRLKLLDQGVKYIEEHMTKRGHLLNLFFCVTLFTNTYNQYQQKKEKYLKLIEHLELPDFN